MLAAKLSAMPSADDKQRLYWSKNLRVIAALLAVWFVVTFVFGYFAGDLDFNFFGWPFSFWAASQGALIVYCLIVWYYAFYMNRLDRQHGAAKDD